ncbi:hypothetical protein ACX4M5_11610 [Roseomonas mucosa]
MGFDLLANPFAILGLAGNATIGAISSRAREMGNGDATAASKLLISPRTRLSAELSFLPGASQEQVDECLKKLRQGVEPDLWPLAPIARANVLAHLASSGKATLGQLRDLVGMQEAAPLTALEAVNNGRVQAGMPPAPAEMGNSALLALSAQHAEALIQKVCTIENGSRFLADLLCEAGDTVSPQAIFLRRCAAGWDRTRSSDLSRMLEAGELIEKVLRDRPEAEDARKLATIIQEYAAATLPQRQAARLLGLPHESTKDARQRWRQVALDLNNRLDAISEALTILEALTGAFDEFDDLQERVAEDLWTCRERIAAGEAAPEIKRLRKAIEASEANPAAFANHGLADGHKTEACPAVVIELYDSFVAAAEGATSQLPWLMLRGFTLVLHNEHSATAAAWSLTLLAIAQAGRGNQADGLLPTLVSDRKNLRLQLLQRDFASALGSKRKGAIRAILPELISLTDEAAQKAEYDKLLRKLQSQAVGSYVRWGFWTAVAAVVLITVVANNRTPSRPPSLRAQPDPGPGVASPVERTAIQPSSGGGTLSMSGLRWCRYEKVKADAAEGYVNALRSDPALNVERFNAVIDAYNTYIRPLNASCASYTYRRSDGATIDAELAEQGSILVAAGRRAMESVYLARIAPRPDNRFYQPPTFVPAPSAAPAQDRFSTSPTAPPVAVTRPPAISPTSTVSSAYADGQMDRRAWEAWVASTTGATRDGAVWWSGVRSTQRPPACSMVPGSIDYAGALAGCNEARTRLAGSDRRRRTEPDYRAGWNNP